MDPSPTAPPRPPTTVVAIGASAGGVEALTQLVARLPADLSAAVLVVLHLAPRTPSVLPRILARHAVVPVLRAEDHLHLQPGTVTVAVPDRHLLVSGHEVRVVEGPSENGHRPAIDVLFRSVARWWDGRSVGVVLTGALDDGSSGLRAIADAGGLCLVQDPQEAAVSSMPAHALAAVPEAEVRSLEGIAERLTALGPRGGGGLDAARRHEVDLLEVGIGAPWVDVAGPPAGLSCPDCGGPLFESPGPDERFRCRVGHGWTAEAMVARHDQELERALWHAARVIEDDVAVQRRLAQRAEAGGHEHAARRIAARLTDRTDLLTTLYALIRRSAGEGT
jgi:two-component system chemotaxis response regulator CheB